MSQLWIPALLLWAFGGGQVGLGQPWARVEVDAASSPAVGGETKGGEHTRGPPSSSASGVAPSKAASVLHPSCTAALQATPGCCSASCSPVSHAEGWGPLEPWGGGRSWPLAL